MSRYALLTAMTAAAAISVMAQLDPAVTTPLADKHFQYPGQIPYMVDTDVGTRRGPQLGYNLCNATTEGPNSLCQTGFVNHIDDFCLWAPSKPNSTIADTEQEEVAWCTKPGRGTRLIPAGALTGVQVLVTPDYIQIVGFIDQTQINMQAGDFGGELDPHGADLRGNPLGGLMYSNAFPSNGGNNNTYQQVIEWHNFMGGNAFCMKICDPAGAHAADFCQHTLDRIGCSYNMPNAAQDKVFEVCAADDMAYPGIYTTNGQVMSYSQPDESLGAITSIPYTPVVPSSSNCVTYQSQDLYTALSSASTPAPTQAAPSSPAAATGSSKPGAVGLSGSPTRSGVAAAVSVSSTSSSNSATSVSVSAATFVGVLFAVVFLS